MDSGGEFTDKVEASFDIPECRENEDCDTGDVCYVGTCEYNGFCSYRYAACGEGQCNLSPYAKDVTVLIETDGNQEETSWVIRQHTDNVALVSTSATGDPSTTTDYPSTNYSSVSQSLSHTLRPTYSASQITSDIMKGGNYTSRWTNYNVTKCVDEGTYKFIMKDSYRDGFHGKYSVLVERSEVLKGPLDEFNPLEERSFEIGECRQDSDCDDDNECTKDVCDAGVCSNEYDCTLCSKVKEVEVSIKLDEWPEETEWKIYVFDQYWNTLMQGGNYSEWCSEVSEIQCFPCGSYEFEISDYSEDGIDHKRGEAAYSLKVGGTEIANGGKFSGSDRVYFDICPPVPCGKAGDSCVSNDDCCKKWKCSNKGKCCKKKGKRCSKNNQCCTGNCADGKCSRNI